MSTPKLKDHAVSKRTIDTQIKSTKVKRLAHHLTIGMSLIAGATIRGSVNVAIPVPASTHQRPRQVRMWSKKGKITNYLAFETAFNPNFLPLDDLRVWLGVAWHELGHTLWSPFDERIPVTMGLNLLEDARVETLILLKYPKMRAALMAALLHLMDGGHVNNTSDAAYSYAWVAGRFHLSKDVRNEARKMLVKLGGDEGRRIANEIDGIYRDYLAMGSALDKDEARRLASELDQLLGTNAPHGAGCGTSMTDTGTDADSPDVDVPDDVLDSVGSDDEGEGDNDTGSNTPDSDTTTETGSGTGGEPTDKQEDDESPSTTTLISPLEPMSEVQDELFKEETDKLRERVRRELEENADDMSKELEEEINKLERIIDIVGGAQGAEIDVKVDPPTPAVKQLAKEISRIAAKFNDDSAKGLMRRRDHGRFKPNRFERYDDLDTAYDQWEPGLSQEMYVAICMDISGSMESHLVTKVLYGLEVGLQDVATTDIALFNDTVRIPAARNTHTKQVLIRTTGGTYPSDALTYLYPRIRRAAQQNKLLVFYTDGVFSNGDSYSVLDAYVSELKREGVNVRILCDPRADITRMERFITSITNGVDLQVIPTVEDLPNIVLSWTRSILSGSIV